MAETERPHTKRSRPNGHATLFASFGYAWAGIDAGWRGHRSFRIEVVCAALALGAALWLGAPLTPIVLACALVLSLELLNSAVEAVVDLVSPEWHPLAKLAKDTAAGAVMLASLGALGVAALELLPPLLGKLG